MARKVLCDVCKTRDSYMPASYVVFDRIVICELCRTAVIIWGREQGYDDWHPWFGEFRSIDSPEIQVRPVADREFKLIATITQSGADAEPDDSELIVDNTLDFLDDL